MSRIITLINEKNHYLEKFFSLNETELKNFLVGNYDRLEYFYNSREKILEIIKYLDSQIEKNLPEGTLSDSVKSMMKEALKVKDQYVSKILEQDLQILSCIEATKNSIIHELSDLRKNKKAVNGYKMKSFTKRMEEIG